MPNIMRDQQDVTVKAEALLAPLAAELDNAGIPYQTVIRHGLPVETIVKVAKEMDAEAIVMFSDGRDDLTDRLFGSITEHVLRNTPLPGTKATSARPVIESPGPDAPQWARAESVELERALPAAAWM